MLGRMETRKLLAFDLDQTIVTASHELPPAIRDTIRRARGAGHHVVVLTGRPLVSTRPVLDELGLDSWYGVNHGALVFGEAGKVLRHSRLPWQEVAAMLGPHAHGNGQAGDTADTAGSFSLEFSCVVDDTLYVRSPDDGRWSWAHASNRRVERFHLDLNTEADKVIFSAGRPFNADIDEVLEHMSTELQGRIRAEFPHLTTYVWSNGFLEITSPESDKGSALKLLAEQLGVPQRDTVAFGDGVNDVTMIEWAGHGVAVGPDVHAGVAAAAQEHIAPPEEGGVARWLERNLGI